MIILKYELKRHRKYILGWAIALALCVFVMTPTYYSFMDVSTGDLYETLGTSDFYKGVGVSMEYLTSPLGIYAFLTSFFYDCVRYFRDALRYRHSHQGVLGANL